MVFGVEMKKPRFLSSLLLHVAACFLGLAFRIARPGRAAACGCIASIEHAPFDLNKLSCVDRAAIRPISSEIRPAATACLFMPVRLAIFPVERLNKRAAES